MHGTMLQLPMTQIILTNLTITTQDYHRELILEQKNLEAFESLEKTSLDLYASVRSLYLQDRKRKIKNLDETTVTMNDDDWEEIDSQ